MSKQTVDYTIVAEYFNHNELDLDQQALSVKTLSLDHHITNVPKEIVARAGITFDLEIEETP